MSAVSGSSPRSIPPGPVVKPISENGRRAASHHLIPVEPGSGALSELGRIVDQLDLVRGVDRTTGHGGALRLAQAYSRNARGDRPGGVDAAESLGPMSGPLG